MSVLKCLFVVLLLVCVSDLFAKVEIAFHGEEKQGKGVFKVAEIKLTEKGGNVFLAVYDEKEKLRLRFALSRADLRGLIKSVQNCLDYRGGMVLDEKHSFYIHAAGGDAKIEKLSKSECRMYGLTEASRQKGLYAKASFCYLGVDGGERLIVNNLQIAVRVKKMVYVILLLTDEDARTLLKSSKKLV